MITIYLFFLSCSDVELIPTTSFTINEKIKSYKGEKAVILNVWALWCVPCIEEFPMLVDFQNENIDLEIFVSADFEDEYEKVKSLIKQGVSLFLILKMKKTLVSLMVLIHNGLEFLTL